MSSNLSYLNPADRAVAYLTSKDAVVFYKALVLSLLILCAFLSMNHVVAATVDDEFKDATDKIAGWVSGNIGKIGALMAVGVGAVMAGWRKDWSWFFGGIVIAIMIGVMLTVINKSFGAMLIV